MGPTGRAGGTARRGAVIPLSHRVALAALLVGVTIFAGWGRPVWLVLACTIPYPALVIAGALADRE